MSNQKSKTNSRKSHVMASSPPWNIAYGIGLNIIQIEVCRKDENASNNKKWWEKHNCNTTEGVKWIISTILQGSGKPTQNCNTKEICNFLKKKNNLF